MVSKTRICIKEFSCKLKTRHDISILWIDYRYINARSKCKVGELNQQKSTALISSAYIMFIFAKNMLRRGMIFLIMKNDMSILCPGSDDGAISWEEFVQFFADGVMGKEEMEKLFHDIDTHNTK